MKIKVHKIIKLKKNGNENTTFSQVTNLTQSHMSVKININEAIYSYHYFY